MAGITRSGSTRRLSFDITPVVKAVEANAVGLILRRVNEGRDIFDKPFAPYSDSYRAALRRGREDPKVDLRLSGGLMDSIHVVDIVKVSRERTEITIAPDAGTSPQKRLVKGKAKNTGERSPPHNVLGNWIQKGIGNQPKRPFLGLSPRDREALRRFVLRALGRS